jgi:GNAT superfamily N-acetyltransferase
LWACAVVVYTLPVLMTNFSIRQATEQDVPLILSFIRQLAEYERLSHEAVVNEKTLRESLFGPRRYAEVLLGYAGEEPVAFAVFFHNFSTFLGRPGLYLEDLFVIPEMRGKGFGRTMLVELARIARERNCGRFEWAVLDWNQPAIQFYKNLGAIPMDEWTIFRVTGEALGRLSHS